MAPIPTARQLQRPALLTPRQRWVHICTQLIDIAAIKERDKLHTPGTGTAQ